MSNESSVLDMGWFDADADLSAKRGYAVLLSADGIELCEAKAANCLGILKKCDGADKRALVALVGIVAAAYGDDVTAGQVLETDANGALVPATDGTVVAIALEAGAATELHPVLLK